MGQAAARQIADLGLKFPVSGDSRAFVVSSRQRVPAVFWTAVVRLRHPNAEKVDFVVSRKKKITHYIANEFQDEIRNQMDPEDREIMGDVIPGEPSDRL